MQRVIIILIACLLLSCKKGNEPKPYVIYEDTPKTYNLVKTSVSFWLNASCKGNDPTELSCSSYNSGKMSLYMYYGDSNIVFTPYAYSVYAFDTVAYLPKNEVVTLSSVTIEDDGWLRHNNNNILVVLKNQYIDTTILVNKITRLKF